MAAARSQRRGAAGAVNAIQERLDRLAEIERRYGKLPASPTREEVAFARDVRLRRIDAWVDEKLASLPTSAISVPGAHAVRRPSAAPRSVRSKGRLARSLVHGGGRAFPYDALLDVLEKQGRPFRKMTPEALRFLRATMTRELAKPDGIGLSQTMMRVASEEALATMISKRLGGDDRYGIGLRPLSVPYRKWKQRAYPGRPIGFLTGELFQAVRQKLKVKWSMAR